MVFVLGYLQNRWSFQLRIWPEVNRLEIKTFGWNGEVTVLNWSIKFRDILAKAFVCLRKALLIVWNLQA